MWQFVRTPWLHAMRFYRLIIHWSAGNVFALAEEHGLDPNPLYLRGMGRVGCFPCINAGKREIRAISLRFPEAIDRIKGWEATCAEASKRGRGTFFTADVTPEGVALARRIKLISDRQQPNLASAKSPWPTARQVVKWARTHRGGRQFNLLYTAFADDQALSYSSQYGLCE